MLREFARGRAAAGHPARRRQTTELKFAAIEVARRGADRHLVEHARRAAAAARLRAADPRAPARGAAPPPGPRGDGQGGAREVRRHLRRARPAAAARGHARAAVQRRGCTATSMRTTSSTTPPRGRSSSSMSTARATATTRATSACCSPRRSASSRRRRSPARSRSCNDALIETVPRLRGREPRRSASTTACKLARARALITSARLTDDAERAEALFAEGLRYLKKVLREAAAHEGRRRRHPRRLVQRAPRRRRSQSAGVESFVFSLGDVTHDLVSRPAYSRGETISRSSTASS